MITAENKPAAEYYIVFTQGQTHWITRWLRKDFSHIYLLTHDEYNWLLLNPTRLYLQIIIPPIAINDSPLPHVLKPGDTVLLIKFKHRDDTQQYGSIGMLNCVTWSKYILGLRLLAFTPYGLYKRLVNFDTKDMDKHAILSIEQVQL